jgi:aspartate oxidase
LDTIDIKIPFFKQVNSEEVQNIMSKYAGIIKSYQGLNKAADLLNELITHSAKSNTFKLSDFESTVIAEVALLLIKDAQGKTENKGVYYNTDLVH